MRGTRDCDAPPMILGPLVFARVCRLQMRKWLFIVPQSAILSDVARRTGRG